MLGRRRNHLWTLLVALLTWLPSSSLAQNQPTSVVIPPPFAPLRIDETATVKPTVLEQTLAEVKAQEERPNQLVVLIHGYDMGTTESSQLYESLSKGLKSRLYPEPTAVVGVQWASGGTSLLNPRGDYFRTLGRARDIGRGPIRQLLLELSERHPGVPISVMAHSMGCEVALAAVVPEIPYSQYQPAGGIYQADQEISLAMAAFLGSDLDYDVWYKAGEAGQKWFARCRLTWATVTDPSSQGDRVLSLRARLRGKAAGALLPRMTEAQLEQALLSRGFYLDGQQVPSNHQFDAYFSPSRIGRLAAALKFITQPGAQEPEELAAMRAAVEAADDMNILLSYLDSPFAGAAFAALWRVERINCGNARHLVDQTLENAILMLANSPQAVWREQAHSQCVTMRKAQFPTDAMMMKAGAPSWARPSRYNPPR